LIGFAYRIKPDSRIFYIKLLVCILVVVDRLCSLGIYKLSIIRSVHYLCMTVISVMCLCWYTRMVTAHTSWPPTWFTTVTKQMPRYI